MPPSCFLVLFFAALAPSAPMPPDRAKDGHGAFVRKLLGPWRGQGGCLGQLTFRADGTFDRKHYGPGNDSVSGTWKVRADTKPPTLVLTSTKSHIEAWVGKTWEAKIVKLDDNVLEYQIEEFEPDRYERPKPDAKDEDEDEDE